MVDQGLVDDFGTFSNMMVVGFIVSAITYAIFSYRLLNRHKRLLENNFSNTERINLNWLKGFIWGVALLFVTVTMVLVSKDVLGISYPFTPDLIFYAIIVLGILCLGYFGIRHQNIFTDNVVLNEVENTRSSYKKSSLNHDLAVEKHQALTKLMSEQKTLSGIELNLEWVGRETGYFPAPPFPDNQSV